jgi:hypothetical protein
MDWSSLLTIVVVIGVWLILTRFVFPRLGVPT